MTSSWYSYLFSLYFSFIQLQIINTNLNSINQSSDIHPPPHVTILGALSNIEHMKILNRTNLYSNNDISISSQSFLINSNPLLTMSKLCAKGNLSHAKIIIAGQPSDNSAYDLTITAVAYLSDFYHIPVLIIGSRENIFSDHTLYEFLIRLVPPYLYEADVWFSVIRKLKYTKVVLIYSQDEESRMVISRFQMLTDDSEIQIERMEEYDSDTNFTSLLTNLTAEDRLSASVFLIHAKADDTDELLSVIVRLQQLEYFVWIINERALLSNSSALFDGILSVRLHQSFNEENLLVDATQLIVSTFTKFLDYPSSFWSEDIPVIDCSSTEPWSYGKEVYRALVNTKIKDAITGNIAFNENGDRIESLYEIINIQHGRSTVVGTYRSNTSICTTSSMCRDIIDKTELKLNEDEIIWSNGQNRKPDGIRARRNVSVVTIAEKPFVFVRSGNNCDPTFEVHCPRRKLDRNSTNEEYEQYCCYGYCIALLQELSKNLSFVYTLHLVADGKYGSFEREGDDRHKRWDGMIGELINYQADMIVAPLTMTPERAEDIEFTKPYKYQGITILVRKNKNTSNFISFLQPFKGALWIMVLLSIHVIAIVLHLLDRFSPLSRFRSTVETHQNDDTLSLSRALWFTWGILLNSGIGEGTPTSFSARVLGMVWAGFAMIMVASYTANLAAFLVLDRPEASISGINDARLRNPQERFTYATVKGSSVDMYFKRQVELSTMYRTMESKNYLTAEDALIDLQNKDLNAFIWDSPRLEYEAALDCDLITAGELFGRGSYAIALRKKDAWVNPLSHTILSFHEKGFMELLDNQWIFSKHEKKCSDPSSSPATLGLHNMLDVFLLVAGGAFAGLFILIIEIIFKRYQERLQTEEQISRTAAAHWKNQITRRKEESSRRFSSNDQNEEVCNSSNVFTTNGIDAHLSSN